VALKLGQRSKLNPGQKPVFLVLSQAVSALFLFLEQALNRKLSKLVINHFFHDLNLKLPPSSDDACEHTCM